MSAVLVNGEEQRGTTAMQTQIRLSALFLAAVISIGVVAGMIALRPPLTQMYYVQLGGLIAGAGLVVTLYNRFLTARARRRAEASSAASEGLGEDCSAEVVIPAAAAMNDAPAPTAYEETREAKAPLDVSAVAYPAAALVSEQPLLAQERPESMDVLLDMAYEAAADNPLRAIAAYRRALACYPEDSYIPYLIIELSTLYKNLGDYDAALALFDEALALPIIAKNAVMVQEFERSRRALTVVSHMLSAQGTPTLPFDEVSKELLAEADRRAQELRKH